MIPAEMAIYRLKRDLALGSMLKAALAAGAVLCVLLEVLVKNPVMSGSVGLFGVGALWLFLSYRSMKGSQMAAASPLLIAAGDFEAAERQIDAALRSFSLFRTVKLRVVHQLLVLRHAQKNWREAIVLGRALLTERLGPLSGLSRSTRLILADALLEQNDLAGAHANIVGLYQHRLSLGEALELNLIQLDYLSRLEAWGQMLEGVERKIELAELLPTSKSARAQALLALAARRQGREELANWLIRRVEVIGEINELVARQPALGELWSSGAGTESEERGRASALH